MYTEVYSLSILFCGFTCEELCWVAEGKRDRNTNAGWPPCQWKMSALGNKCKDHRSPLLHPRPALQTVEGSQKPAGK